MFNPFRKWSEVAVVPLDHVVRPVSTLKKLKIGEWVYTDIGNIQVTGSHECYLYMDGYTGTTVGSLHDLFRFAYVERRDDGFYVKVDNLVAFKTTDMLYHCEPIKVIEFVDSDCFQRFYVKITQGKDI